SRAVARLHGLEPGRTIIARQHPAVIDAGVFHNDVIAVGDRSVLLHHEFAFEDVERLHADLAAAVDFEPTFLVVPEAAVSVETAVRTYLFNSQLIDVAGRTVLVAPEDVRHDPDVSTFLDSIVGGPIAEVLTFDLRQSMQNGGGPACLRLRVVLTDDERAAVNPGSLLSNHLYERLVEWITRYYRDELTANDLGDPALYAESCSALDELTSIMGLGSLYDFQR
ncbi:MAG: N-succinylarginine dihydrolase, partial [Acidimicrobiia bacterium]|nr:N-succinylarginine dihydrolase [Acidimicrobiia bacterium]